MNNMLDFNITYRQEKKGMPFDWNEFLNKEKHTPIEWIKASEMSVNWVTCACGNQCAVIPRDPFGTPFDDCLTNLGLNFHSAIKEKNIELAKKILRDIELRSQTLIELIKKVNNIYPCFT